MNGNVSAWFQRQRHMISTGRERAGRDGRGGCGHAWGQYMGGPESVRSMYISGDHNLT